jgi:hypothetical protein
MTHIRPHRDPRRWAFSTSRTWEISTGAPALSAAGRPPG